MTNSLEQYRHALISNGVTRGTAAATLTMIRAVARHGGIDPDTPGGPRGLTGAHCDDYGAARGLAANSLQTVKSQVSRYRFWCDTGSVQRRYTGKLPAGWDTAFRTALQRAEIDGKDRAASTINRIVQRVGTVARFHRMHPAALTRAQFIDWRTHMDTQTDTVYPYLNAVATAVALWGRFLGRAELTDLPRFTESKRCNPRNSRPVEQWLLDRMLAAGTDHEVAMLLLGTQAGMRAHEISKCDTRHFTPFGRRYKVGIRGKGSSRLVKIEPAVFDKLKATVFPPGGGRLFPHLNIDPEKGAVQVNRTLVNLAHRCGGGMTSHQLRHWCANMVYRLTGGDLAKTQQVLGHASIATTQSYLLPMLDDDNDLTAGMAAAIGLNGPNVLPEGLRAVS